MVRKIPCCLSCTKQFSCQQFHLGVFFFYSPTSVWVISWQRWWVTLFTICIDMLLNFTYFTLRKWSEQRERLAEKLSGGSMCTVQVTVNSNGLLITIYHSPFWVWDSMSTVRLGQSLETHWGGLSSAAFSHLSPSCLKAAVDRTQ